MGECRARGGVGSRGQMQQAPRFARQTIRGGHASGKRKRATRINVLNDCKKEQRNESTADWRRAEGVVRVMLLAASVPEAVEWVLADGGATAQRQSYGGIGGFGRLRGEAAANIGRLEREGPSRPLTTIAVWRRFNVA